ncbi:hypothetical protein [Microbispora sp. NBC_01389]|uniref:hypothetical protein n=1 Tax=Microbispora sp. NBC_01389 TaxID=2903584 RepID=UPI0032483BBF
MTAVVIPAMALTRLREHLAQHGITVNDDAVTVTGDYRWLRLSDRLEVWCGPEWYPWITRGRAWHFAGIDDPETAARQLADALAASPTALAARLPVWRFWRAHIDGGFSHIIDADTLDQFLTRLRQQEELARTLS